MVLSFGVTALAAEITVQQATVLIDNSNMRTVIHNNVTATYDKNTNTMYVNDGINNYSFSLNYQDEIDIGIVRYANCNW